MTFLDVAPLPPERTLCDMLSTPTAWMILASIVALAACLALAVAYRRRVAN